MQDSTSSYAERARRTRREIVLAVMLTLAAIAFLIAALMSSSRETENARLNAPLTHIAN